MKIASNRLNINDMNFRSSISKFKHRSLVHIDTAIINHIISTQFCHFYITMVHKQYSLSLFPFIIPR